MPNIPQPDEPDKPPEVRLPTQFCLTTTICRQGGRQTGISHFKFRVYTAVVLLGINRIGHMRIKYQDLNVRDDLDKERTEGSYHLNSTNMGDRQGWHRSSKGKSMKRFAGMRRKHWRARSMMMTLPATFEVETSQREILGFVLNDYEPSARYKRLLRDALTRCGAVKAIKVLTGDNASPRFQTLKLTLDSSWFPTGGRKDKAYCRMPWPGPSGPIEMTLWLRLHAVDLSGKAEAVPKVLRGSPGPKERERWEHQNLKAESIEADQVRYTMNVKRFCEGLGIDTKCQPSHWRRRLFAALKAVNRHARELGLREFTISLVGDKGDRVRLGRA